MKLAVVIMSIEHIAMYVVPKNSIKSIKNMVEDSDKSKPGSVKGVEQ